MPHRPPSRRRPPPGSRRRGRLGVLVLAGAAGAGFALGWNAAGDRAAARAAGERGAPAVLTAGRRSTPPAPITFAFGGDVMLGADAFGLPPNGGAGALAPVARLLRADVTVGNLEGALTRRGVPKCPARAPDATGPVTCYAFRTPPSYAAHLASAGFTVMSQANNHAHDYGVTGLDDTRAALTAAGIAPTGAPGTWATRRVRGTRVAVLAFAPYPWANPLTDIPAATALVRRARADADVVVVTMHAGAEGAGAATTPRGAETYLGEPRGDVRAFAHAVVDAGADLVVGHGPHVLRGIEVYRGRLVAYSLGNFAGYRAFGLGGPLSAGAVLRVSVRPDGVPVAARLAPVTLVGAGLPVPGGDGVARVRDLSRRDFGASAAPISARGVIGLPPVVDGVEGWRDAPAAPATGDRP